MRMMMVFKAVIDLIKQMMNTITTQIKLTPTMTLVTKEVIFSQETIIIGKAWVDRQETLWWESLQFETL